MYIKRDYYLKKLINKKDNGRVKIITGIRRTGKSYLLFKIYINYLKEQGIKENQIIKISLEDIENIKYRNPFKLNEYIKEKTKKQETKYYVFIDEIQFSKAVKNPYIDEDEKSITFVDVLLSLMKQENLDIYVTGSNSKMLSKDILTQFNDRGDEIHVKPLSYKEIYQLYEDKTKAINEYTLYGGMPYIYSLKSDEEKSKYLKDLFKKTYIKDVIERNNIQNDKMILEILLDFTASSIGSLINPNKLSKRYLSEKKINISPNTIATYLTYFEEAYVINQAKRYDVKGSRYFTTPSKYYFQDIGLRNARLNFRQIEETHIMENIIYNELIRREYNVDVGVVECEIKENGKRNKKQLEIDFVVNKGNNRYYIQSALKIENEEKRKMETESFRRTKDSFKKIIIVREKIKPRYDENGILYMGLETFLLNENAINL